MECTSKLILFRKFRQKCVAVSTFLDTLLGTDDRDADGPSAMESCIDEEIADIPTDNVSVDEEVFDTEATEENELHEGINHDHLEYPDSVDEHFFSVIDEECTADTYGTVEVLEEYEEEETTYAEDDDFLINPEPSPSSDTTNIIYLNEPTSKPIVNNHQPPSQVPSNITCDICGAHFSRKTTMRQHRLSHSKTKNFCCDLCGQKFTRRAHLVCHKRIHLQQRPFACPHFGKSFVKASDMERHRLVHSSVKRFACTVCDKRFKRSTDVNTHMLTHTGRRPYRCKIHANCEKSYTSFSSLKKHIAAVHPEAASS